MFGYKENKNKKFDLVLEERANFLLVLNELMNLLLNSGNTAQSDFVRKLIELCNQNKLNHFAKLINGVDMWGGAGAVWEVYIEDQNMAMAFEKEMLRLISLMEKTKIIENGVKQIKKIFEDNLKSG